MLLSGPDERFEEIIAPEAQLSPFMAPKGYRGPEGARRYWEEAASGAWEISVELGAVRTRGEKALATGTLEARRGIVDERHELTWGARVQDSLIQEFCAFTDPAEAERWFSE